MTLFRLTWVPNALTVMRLVLGLALAWLPATWQFWALLVGGFSDLVDGWISRSLGVASGFGQFVDPIADKTLFLAAAATALMSGWMTGWELLALAARDVAVCFLSVRALSLDWGHWRKLTPRLSGKIATGAQVAVLLTLFWRREPYPALVWAAASLSIWSAIDYSWRAHVASSERSSKS